MSNQDKKCHFCDTVIEKYWYKRCKACGGRVYESYKTCHMCQEIIDDKAMRCPYCHTYFILPVYVTVSIALTTLMIVIYAVLRIGQ